MRSKMIALSTALALTGLSLAGCGGDGGQPPAGFSKGAITATATGSIVVNGVEFNTTGATLKFDDVTDTTLQPGMVVTVQGSFNDSTHGTASNVTFADDVQGPVDSINSTGIMLVMGQPVQVIPPGSTAANTTVFANFSSLGNLPPGTVVKVSGFPHGPGGIQATRIEKKGALASGSLIELKGTASSVNTATNSLVINGLQVNYTSAPGSLANGTFVKVTGLGSGYTSSLLLILNGASVQLFNGGSEAVAGQEGAHMELAGFVTDLNMDTFKVGGTQVKSGSVPLPAGFGNNVKVLVKGTLSNGVIMASQVTLQ